MPTSRKWVRTERRRGSGARRETEPDILIHTSGGALVGHVKAIRGRESADKVIRSLLAGMEKPKK